MTLASVILAAAGAIAPATGAAELKPYLMFDGQPAPADSVQVTTEHGAVRLGFMARRPGTYRVGLSITAPELAPLAPGLPALKSGGVQEPVVLRYPYDWTWRGRANVLSRRPRLVMPGVRAGGKLYIMDTRELCAIRIEPAGDGLLRAVLLKHRYHNDGGDASTADLELAEGERVELRVRVFDTLAQANEALFGKARPLKGRMTQIAFRGWTAKSLSKEEYARVADGLRGCMDYVIVREIEPHAWIPGLLHERGLKAWHYQYWGALRRHSSQVTDEIEARMGMKGGAKRYTAPKSPEGAWLLCDIRRDDVRQVFVDNARRAVAAGFDGVFLDGYPVWPDTNGRRGGSVPGAACSLHYARWRLLKEIVQAVRGANPDAVVGILGNNYYDTLGEADFALKERMYWSWVKFDRRFERRVTRVRMGMDAAFEDGEAPFAAKALAYGFKGYSPMAVQSAAHFVRRPTGLNYFGAGDFFREQLDDWLATIRAIADERQPHIKSIEPGDAYVTFEGRDALRVDRPCRVVFSVPVCIGRGGARTHRAQWVRLDAGDGCRVMRQCADH